MYPPQLLSCSNKTFTLCFKIKIRWFENFYF